MRALEYRIRYATAAIQSAHSSAYHHNFGGSFYLLDIVRIHITFYSSSYDYVHHSTNREIMSGLFSCLQFRIFDLKNIFLFRDE